MPPQAEPLRADVCTDAKVDVIPAVRIRTTAKDQYADLRGHAYIIARGLNTTVQRVQTSALQVPSHKEGK